jgi:hypothetical protein
MTRLMALATTVAVFAIPAGMANAQQAACQALLAQGCACVAPLGTDVVGALSGVQGNVVVSGQANFSPANGASGLHVNDGIFVGPDGRALVTFGSCQGSPLPPSSTASVTAIGNCACLQVRNTPAPAAVGSTLAVIGGGLADYLIQQGKGPVSP